VVDGGTLASAVTTTRNCAVAPGDTPPIVLGCGTMLKKWN